MAHWSPLAKPPITAGQTRHFWRAVSRAYGLGLHCGDGDGGNFAPTRPMSMTFAFGWTTWYRSVPTRSCMCVSSPRAAEETVDQVEALQQS